MPYLFSRTFMGGRFGVDFGSVRVHTGAEARDLNRSLHAYAFTSGSDIFFADGQFHPGTTDGDRLLAHELTHVVQQTGAVQRSTETRVQTLRLGNWAHQGIQDRLIAENPSLLGEVHIPGALSRDAETAAGFDLDNLDKRGFADLYHSAPNIVSGIRSGYPSKPGVPKQLAIPRASTSTSARVANARSSARPLRIRRKSKAAGLTCSTINPVSRRRSKSAS